MQDEYADPEYDRQCIAASRGVLELAVRQLRAFARFVAIDQNQADELVEDTLLLFLADDRVLCDADACFAELLSFFRKTHARMPVTETEGLVSGAGYGAMLLLTIPEREIAALCISARMGVGQAAGLLCLCPEEAVRLLESGRSKLEFEAVPGWPFRGAGGASEADL